MDPRTGRPADGELVSVTVFHSQAAYADGYATALLVLGRREGAILADRLQLRAVMLGGAKE
jgi:FAD:protein FMN transferase